MPDLGGEWRLGNKAMIWSTLTDAGVDTDQVGAVTDALLAAGLVVVADYYVPTDRELFSQYSTLGEAYLHGRINVRWVMCAETHDALFGIPIRIDPVARRPVFEIDPEERDHA